ncbi:MAG: hypothetical protein AB7R69_03615 [Candidatus Babeliales bacterium]
MEATQKENALLILFFIFGSFSCSAAENQLDVAHSLLRLILLEQCKLLDNLQLLGTNTIAKECEESLIKLKCECNQLNNKALINLSTIQKKLKVYSFDSLWKKAIEKARKALSAYTAHNGKEQQLFFKILSAKGTIDHEIFLEKERKTQTVKPSKEEQD